MDDYERFEKLKDELPDYIQSFFISKNDSYQIKTQIGYAMDLKNFLKWFLDVCAEKTNATELKGITCKDLERLTYDDIDAYMAYLSQYRTKNKKNQTIIVSNDAHGKARKLAAIRTLFKYLLKRGYIAQNPIELVETPKIRKDKAITTLSKEQQDIVLNKAYCAEGRPIRKKGQTARGIKKSASMRQKTRLRDYAILSTLLSSGIRVSELCGIDMFDINFDEQYFIIVRKGGSTDKVYFGKEAHDAIIDYIEFERYAIAGHEKDEPEFAKFDNSNGPLFITGHKGDELKRITPRRIQQIVKEYAAFVAPENEKITPHTLRKTFGTALFRDYKNLMLVQHALGHADSSTTSKYYVGFDNDELKVIKDR